jgi:hypothetical protein
VASRTGIARAAKKVIAVMDINLMDFMFLPPLAWEPGAEGRIQSYDWGQRTWIQPKKVLQSNRVAILRRQENTETIRLVGRMSTELHKNDKKDKNDKNALLLKWNLQGAGSQR